MKVFQLVKNPYKQQNPYISSLMDGISTEHKDIVWGYGIDNFWTDSIYDYDIIHIHWPDQILKSDLCKKEHIGGRLNELKSKGAKIIVTCHNFEPHYCKIIDREEAYEIIYSHADCFIHLGDYSKRIMEVRYPQASHGGGAKVPDPIAPLRYCITKVPSLCLKVANDSASLRLCVPACAYNVLALLHF